MYLLELIFDNSAHNGDGKFRFRKRRDSRSIAKWTHLGNDKAARELLRLITIGLGGARYLNAVGVPAKVAGDRQWHLKVMYVLARHQQLDISSNTRFTRSTFHFSLNHDRNLNLIARKYRMFDFRRGDNVEFVCMYGYNTTLAEDVDRFSFLRSLPGAYVFVQKYLPIRGGPAPNTVDFFGKNPDRYIDELIRIIFTQNMKSMENYYRWVSRRYAETFGKLHMGLVDTIFRYNKRHKKGEYIASLAGTKRRTL